MLFGTDSILNALTLIQMREGRSPKKPQYHQKSECKTMTTEYLPGFQIPGETTWQVEA